MSLSTGAPVTAVARCVDAVRTGIMSGALQAGQRIGQERLASELGVSHIPLREALKSLESQGFVRHIPNVGYSVTEFNRVELEQIHFMRRALETAVCSSLPKINADAADELRSINEGMAAAMRSGDFTTASRLNKEFHFALFATAGMGLVLDELDRLWSLSDFYRLLYLAGARDDARLLTEHDEMISLALAGKRADLGRLMNAHRSRSLDHVALHLASAVYRE